MGCISGEWDDMDFNIFVMKEPDCNIMPMSTYSVLTVPDNHKEEIRIFIGEVIKFSYPEFFSYNYRYSERQREITIH